MLENTTAKQSTETSLEKQQKNAQQANIEQIAPECDVEESKNEYIVYADMPGLDLEKIHVELDRDILTVDGTEEVEGLQPIHYIRQFRVVHGLDASRVHADYHNGVLTIRLAKPEEQKPKQIQITCA